MYRKSSWIKHLDFTVIDIMCMELSLAAAFFIRNALGGGLQAELYLVFAVLLLVVNVLTVLLNESYKSILRRGYWKEFHATIIHTSIVMVSALLLLYLLHYSGFYSRGVFLIMWFLYSSFTYFARILWKCYLKDQAKRWEGNRSLLIVARKEQAKELAEHIQENNYNSWRTVSMALTDEAESDATYAGIPTVAVGNGILEYIRTGWVDEVFLDYHLGDEEMEQILFGCEEMGVTVHIRMSEIFFGCKQRMERVGGYKVLTSTHHIATAGQIFWKRALDIAGSLVGLAITGIAFLFVAPAVFIASPGPIFFSQMRVGRNGKLFKLYKFRSMYTDAEERKKELLSKNEYGEESLMFKMKDDPRIIKGVGHFIRKTSIDELPQFWNVLKGEMSLVGTRPPTLEEWERYDLRHRKRMMINPGITGLWQVSGRSKITDFEEVVRLDTDYIENWSPGLDFRILFKTIEIVLRGEGAA